MFTKKRFLWLMGAEALFLFGLSLLFSQPYFGLGALIYLVPTLAFGLIFFSATTPTSARGAFYLGEGLKWFLVLLFLSLSFLFLTVEPLPLFVGIIMAQMVHAVIFLRFSVAREQ